MPARLNAPSTTRARVAEGMGIVAAYTALAWVWMYPLFLDLGGTVVAPDRRWLSGWVVNAGPDVIEAIARDIHLFVWTYAWNWHALLTQPAAWFQANIFYPAPDTLAYSEHAIGTLPVTGPLQALSGNAVFAHQGYVLLSFGLSGGAMYALLRHLGAGRAAAWLAGLVYAFAPVRRESLFHSYLLAGQWFPLALLYFDRVLGGARWRAAAAYGTAMLLHCLSSYYLAYQALVVLPFAAALAWIVSAPRPTAGLLRAGAALAAVGVACAVVSLPYLRVRAGGGLAGFVGAEGALVRYSNDLWRCWFLPTWLLAGDATLQLARGAHAYVGLAALALAVLGLGRLPEGAGAEARRMRAAAAAIAVVAWIMALGPVLPAAGGPVTLPYALVMRIVPGFDSMRVPYRFALTFMAGFAILVGLGADRLWRAVAGRGPAHRAVATAAALTAVVCIDYGLGFERWQTRPLLVGARGPRVYRKLATLPPGPTLELPFATAGGVFASERMVHSTTHWMPLLPGSSGYAPASQQTLTRLANRLPDPRALALLGRMTGLRYIVLHLFDLPEPMQRRWLRRNRALRLKYATGRERLYEVRHPPPADLVDLVRACARDQGACGRLHALAEP